MEWRVVDKIEARRAGVDPALLRADPHLVADAAALSRFAVWSEEPLGGGWIASYRIAAANGKPVVAELRLFPDRWARGVRPPGRWAGDYLDQPEIPDGGLSATVLRRVKLAEPFKDALTLLERHRESLPDVFADRGPLRGLDKHPATAPRIENAELERIARAYVAANYSSSAVARRFRLRESTVRGRILMARRRGILSSPGKRGARGGNVLTKRKGARDAR